VTGESASALAAMLFVIGLFMGAFVGSCATNSRNDMIYQAQAVRNGCGSFPVIDTLTGETEFRWNRPTPTKD